MHSCKCVIFANPWGAATPRPSRLILGSSRPLDQPLLGPQIPREISEREPPVTQPVDLSPSEVCKSCAPRSGDGGEHPRGRAGMCSPPPPLKEGR